LSNGTQSKGQIIRFQDAYRVFMSKSRHQSKAFVAARNINLDVREGEFVTLVGPSGCGKSTLLNMVAGLLKPTSGTIHYRGREINQINTDVGYITQDDNLLPWRTVIDNVALALEFRGMDKKQRYRLAEEKLATVGLTGFEHFYPHELSGGMRKRVGIIRTLVYNPSVLLMDEPFGPLDAQTRVILQDELLRLWQQSRQTVLFVTHDLVESIALSDRIVVFTHAPGTIKKIYDVNLPRPRDVFHIHETPGFDQIYDALWKDIKEEIQGMH
jgi:NitT/TauT family transport system ATP-binding protein